MFLDSTGLLGGSGRSDSETERSKEQSKANARSPAHAPKIANRHRMAPLSLASTPTERDRMTLEPAALTVGMRMTLDELVDEVSNVDAALCACPLSAKKDATPRAVKPAVFSRLRSSSWPIRRAEALGQ